MLSVRTLSVSIFCSVMVLCSSASAEWLKVDLSAPGQSGGAQGFTNWEVAPVNGTATTTISGLTFTITQTSPAVDSTHYPKCGYANKDGKTYNFKLSYDGVWPHWKDDSRTADMPYPDGGAMQMTISGLSEGPHNIVMYHNDPYYSTTTWTTTGTGGKTYHNNSVSDCNIAVNGVYVKTVRPTINNRNDATCGYSFFTVNATAGAPVVISMTPASNGEIRDVFLNGFEIDAPGEPSAMANTPSPADGDLHANCNNDDPAAGHAADGYTTLSWTPSAFATCHGVYFGTSQTAVTNGTTTTPNVYFGTQTATTFPRTGLTSKYTYYWRIDEINAQGVTTKGPVWSFRPRRLAYPGAVGYGRWTHAGRYGQVIEVTNLNDSGEGSLRDALQVHTGPRVVVFKVGGVIALQSKLQILGGYGDVYVAGQTAPGNGITLTQYNLGPYGTKDVMIRHVRLRVGDYGQEAIDGIGLSSCDYCLIDHCTISWCIDVAHNSLNPGNNTFTYNILSEGLYDSYHYSGTHSLAASIGGHNATYARNLLAHCAGRNWSLAGGLEADGKHYGGYLDIRNNVVYNWEGRTNDGGAKAVNLVGNYYKGGPQSDLWWLLALDGDELSLGDYQQAYVTGNKMIRQNGSLVIDPSGDNWNFCSVNKNATVAQCKSTTPLIGSENYVTLSADAAYTDVLANAGATRPARDAIDTRVVNDVRNATYTYTGSRAGKRGIIDTQDDVTSGGYAGYALVNHIMPYTVGPTDSDHDGMPDAWETTHSLNPNNYNDAMQDPDNDGYTNLDYYLAVMAGDVSDTAIPDNTAPTPNPMTFASAPAGISSSSITMTATTATDDSGVQYLFHCLTTGGHDSAWQDSATYTDTGLTPSTSYSYQVKARDKSSNLNETAYSAEASGTTQVPVETVPPQPDPMTWATEPHAISYASISMTATTATDDNGVQYYFTCTSGGGHSSGWQDSPSYTDTSLAYNSTYTYTVKARDKSSNYNTTAESSPVSASTGPDDDAPLPNPMTWTTAPYGINYSTIYMVASGAADISGVEYYFTCTSGGGHDSGWQSGTGYLDGGLSEGQVCTYSVQVRDKSVNHNTTAPSSVVAAATMNHAPTPAQMAFETAPYASSASSIAMTAVEASDVNGVQYYFACTAGGGHDSGWQDSRSYTDSGLLNNATYAYRVIARDKSDQGKENTWSDAAVATTPLYVCTQSIVSDVDGNCQADFLDFAALANTWSQTPPTVERAVNGSFDTDIVPGWRQLDLPSATGAFFAWYDNTAGDPIGAAGIASDNSSETTSGHYLYQAIPVTTGMQYTFSAEWTGDMSSAGFDPANRTLWSRVLVFFEGSADPNYWTSLGNPDSIAYGKSFGATSQNIGAGGAWDWEQITASPVHGPVDGLFTATAGYMVIALESGGLTGSDVGFYYLDNVSVTGSACPQHDLNSDCKLDFTDLCQLAADWLGCNRSPASECWQ